MISLDVSSSFFFSTKNYKCTPEESRVFAKCEQDALIRRAIPFAIGFGVGTFCGIQKGYLKVCILFHCLYAFQNEIKIFNISPQANVRFGPWPKVIGASALGYIIGKFSYMDECEERIMALPNSRLAQMLRSRSQKHNNNFYSNFDEIKETNATEERVTSLAPQAPLRFDEFNQVNKNGLFFDW